MSVSQTFTSADVPDQTGKCFLVTGANSGVGFQAARVLAARGGRVLLACRSEAKARLAMDLIAAETARADLAFIPLDQADLGSIRRAAELAGRESRIDALVNNAGVMTGRGEVTRQGFEIHFGVNHLGCFALTSLLLPKLAECPGARIVVTSSGLHRKSQALWADPNANRDASGMGLYGASKLANMLFVNELSRRLHAAKLPVMAVSSHPGFAPTGLGSGSLFHRFGMPIIGLLFNTAEMSAWGSLQAATGVVRAGAYYGPKARGELRGPSGECLPSALAQDPALARDLWGLSIKLTDIDPGLPSA